ncbi:response regulator [Desulfococcaceae bacterium HSG9]|nr:response regulator [Desulfococcaceae bacterium HSG9]
MSKNQPESEAKKVTLLFVDDLPENLQILTNIFKDKYHTILVATSGKEALELVHKMHPDIILLDIMMPAMDGFEVCLQLKMNDNTKNIPIIFITAKNEPQAIVKGFKLGAADYVTKPFNSAELIARVNTQIREKQNRDLILEMNKRLQREIKIRQQISEEKLKLEAQVFNTRKMEAIAALAGGVAHKFNNALNVITGSIDLLKMSHLDDKIVMKNVDRMMSSSKRMVHLTSQLLAYARGGKYRPDIMSLGMFVRQSLPILQHAIGNTIELETVLNKDMFRIEADSVQMQMVLSAILTNATEATAKNGVIRITTQDIVVDKTSLKDHPAELKCGPYVCLTIQDNGEGMNAETQSKVFEPFFTTKFYGRGLSMAAVYGIVRNHHGSVVLDSEPGKGTTVRIYLPAKSVKPAKTIVPDEIPDKGAGTILLIEDEEIICDVTETLLKNLGYNVLTAQNGAEAVSLAKNFEGEIDLALLDIGLPDMKGGEIYHLITKERPDMKVIVCSGFSIDGPVQKILDAGAHGFIQKPYTFAALSARLKKVLEA